MDFGRDNTTDISTIDFSFPRDSEFNQAILLGNPADEFTFLLGAPKIGHDHWKGDLYPYNHRSANNLQEAKKHFNFIELNTTFYAPPKEELVNRWRDGASGSDLIFCPKMTRAITHIKRMTGTGSLVEEFVSLVKRFGTRLGPTLIQLPDNSQVKNYATLVAFLTSLPEGFKVNLELRHPTWFEDKVFS